MLARSAMTHFGMSDQDEENRVIYRKICDKSKESSFWVNETECETDSISEEEEEFMDAED